MPEASGLSGAKTGPDVRPSAFRTPVAALQIAARLPEEAVVAGDGPAHQVTCVGPASRPAACRSSPSVTLVTGPGARWA